jgi:hypothetical protein
MKQIHNYGKGAVKWILILIATIQIKAGKDSEKTPKDKSTSLLENFNDLEKHILVKMYEITQSDELKNKVESLKSLKEEENKNTQTEVPKVEGEALKYSQERNDDIEGKNLKLNVITELKKEISPEEQILNQTPIQRINNSGDDNKVVENVPPTSPNKKLRKSKRIKRKLLLIRNNSNENNLKTKIVKNHNNSEDHNLSFDKFIHSGPKYNNSNISKEHTDDQSSRNLILQNSRSNDKSRNLEDSLPRIHKFKYLGLDFTLILTMAYIPTNSDKSWMVDIVIEIKAFEEEVLIYEEKHLFGANLARGNSKEDIEAEVSAIVVAFKVAAEQKLTPAPLLTIYEGYKAVIKDKIKSKFYDINDNDLVFKGDNIILAQFILTKHENDKEKETSSTLMSFELKSDISRDDTGFALLLIKLGSDIYSIKISRRGFKFEKKEDASETPSAITIPKELEPFADSFSEWFKLHVISSVGNQPKSMFQIIKDQIIDVFTAKAENSDKCYDLESNKNDSKSEISTSSLHVYLKNSSSPHPNCKHDKNFKNSSDHLYFLFTPLDLGSSFSFGLLKIESDTQVVEIFINLNNYKDMVTKELVAFQENDKYDLSKANGALFDAEKLKKIVIKSNKIQCDDDKKEIPPKTSTETSTENSTETSFLNIDFPKNIFECFKKDKKTVIMTCHQVSDDQFKIILIIPSDLDKEKLKNLENPALDLEFNVQKYNSYDQVDKIQPNIEAFLKLIEEPSGPNTLLAERKLVSY